MTDSHSRQTLANVHAKKAAMVGHVRGTWDLVQLAEGQQVLNDIPQLGISLCK